MRLAIKFKCSFWLLVFTTIVCILPVVKLAAQSATPRFSKRVITSDFISEGIAIADINKDGKNDIVAGAYWFEAPKWAPHEIAKPQHYAPATEFSNSFLNFCLDVNQDGWIDQIRISLPGEEIAWYENPGKKSGWWKMHPVISNAGNESPAFFDVDGDGRPDIICNDPIAKEMIWLKSPSVKGDTVFQKHVISTKDAPGTGRYTHGLGWIDMNKDGRKDIVITKGWWECPVEALQPNWVFHPEDLGEDCSQIFALDADGDGNQDLISTSAHDYGIWWHQKIKDQSGNTSWVHHVISKLFSETHALAMADVNGDGNPDLVTGKRYFAHNGKDPGGMDAAVLYWYEYKPGKEPVWVPHQLDDNSGVGLQVFVQDINNDGLPDIITANKKGVFIFEQKKP